MALSGIEEIGRSFREWQGKEADDIRPLPPSGSHRDYFRITGGKQTVIAAINTDRRENEAFIYLTRHFTDKGLPVPKLFVANPESGICLLEDLGDESMFSVIEKEESGALSLVSERLYQEAVAWLVEFQTKGAEGLDFSKCHPREAFDTQSVTWDLNYFKYHFLKLKGIPFDEQALEDDFKRLTGLLKSVEARWFMYRDFQARNIMVQNGNLRFIDYQGGKRGPLQYDLVSLLFQARASLLPDDRQRLLEYYLDVFPGNHLLPSRKKFHQNYPLFILLRNLQVLGAYGFRGIHEKKPHFLASMKMALTNSAWIIEHIRLPVNLPEIWRCLEKAIDQSENEPAIDVQDVLTLSVKSFSYKTGIPSDPSGNGGGFVFDCRALPNPGRLPEFRALTGLDEPVRKFLGNHAEVLEYIRNVEALVGSAVHNYLERGFTHLMVSFGCTGGQHRSVFCAEEFYRRMQNRFPAVRVVLKHRELNTE
ncbi:MAG: phosphotransferase [Bacteroidales bacterium]|nr:phosphotransferase [Bacteroidales bacterium]